MNDGNISFSTDRPSRVLVVDDEEKNRALLKDSLEARGYEVEEAGNGHEALTRVAAKPPDVILLDVMMPDMDGFETCRELKRNPKTSPIPVLMITSLSDRDERLNAIKEGANDFLLKPIDLQDVLLRVRNAVQMKRMHEELEQHNARMEKLVLRSDLTYRIIEELLTPVSAITKAIDQAGLGLTNKRVPIEQRLLTDAARGAVDLERSINFILDVGRFEAGEMPVHLSTCALDELTRLSVEEAVTDADDRQINIELQLEKVSVQCDEQLTRKVLSTLLHNAIKATPSSGSIDVRVIKRFGQGRIAIIDHGPELPKEYRSKIFAEFSRGEKTSQSHAAGLGLTFCRLAIQAQNGRIAVEADPEGGNNFWFELPA